MPHDTTSLDDRLSAIEPHPLAAAFPMLSRDELRRLADDIATQGQHEPITLYQDRILDGRNRHAACQLAGIEPKFRKFEGAHGDVAAFVVSKNLRRRDLDASQRAATVVKLDDVVQAFAVQARERMVRGTANPSAPVRKGATSVAAQLAALAGVSTRLIEQALRVKRADPEMLEAVARGEITIAAAEREILRHRKHTTPTPKPKDTDDVLRQRRANAQRSAHASTTTVPPARAPAPPPRITAARTEAALDKLQRRNGELRATLGALYLATLGTGDLDAAQHAAHTLLSADGQTLPPPTPAAPTASGVGV